MASESDEAAMNLYQSIMVEVKTRYNSMNTFIENNQDFPSILIREYCFLQFRMICELIALGCLVAHGDIKETKAKDFQKAYKADDILKRLEGLHPEFYPVPVKTIIGVNSVHLEPVKTDFLTKDELYTLYGKCGDVLHKGSIRQLISPRIPHQTNFPDIEKWGQKILNLLGSHRLSRIGGRFHFLTLLASAQNGGSVQVAIAESPKEAQISSG